MSVSIQEIGLILLSCIIVAMPARRRVWLWGIPAQLAIIAACTPADPISLIAIGLPCSLIYAFALVRTEKQVTPAPAPTEQ